MSGTSCLVRPDPEADRQCLKSLGDGTTCCVEHAAQLARSLHDVPALVADLEVTLTRQDRLGAPARSPDGTLMWKPAVPDALWALGNTVTTWARLLAERNKTSIGAGAVSNRPIRGSALDHVRPTEGTGLGAPRCDSTGLIVAQCAHCRGLPERPALPDDAVPSRPQPPRPAPVLGQRGPTALDGLELGARWLVRNVHLLRRDVEAHEAHDELAQALAQASAACSAPALRLFVGACGAWYTQPDGRHVHCTEDLYARPDFQAITCPRCLEVHTDTSARWHQALRRIKLWPATAAVIAHHVGELYGQRIDRKTINQWHRRNKLTPVDYDDDGNPRFRIGAVLDVARHSRRPAAEAAS